MGTGSLFISLAPQDQSNLSNTSTYVGYMELYPRPLKVYLWELHSVMSMFIRLQNRIPKEDTDQSFEI